MGSLSELDTTERAALFGPLEPRVREAMAWYERETGYPATTAAMGRVLNILLYAERHGLALDDCALTPSSDPMWAQRGVRTPAEAKAELIGSAGGTRAGGQRSTLYLYIHPREAG